ncbi:MAG: tetratricopeptide repeat protein, partial [Candidatus Omnitrophica bacterium]|nr:tetratricopeptide repeat protein [Candidatus Omnitrophota bacterium]
MKKCFRTVLNFFTGCLLVALFLLVLPQARADDDSVPDIGETVCVYGCGESSSYQSTWGWKGWDPNSDTSSSSSGYRGGGGRQRAASSKPAYDPREDKGLIKRNAKKDFKNGDWNGAAVDAYNYLELTGWKDKKMLYLHARATHLEFLEWLEEGRGDGTYDWQHKKVIEAYQKLLNLYPEHKDGQKYLAEAQAMRKEDYNLKPSAAAIDYGNGYYRNGKKYMDEGRWDDALKSFQTAVQWNWTDHEAIANIAWLLEKRGEKDQARAAYLEAIRQGSHDPVVFSNLASLQKEISDYDAVIRTAEKGLELHPDSPELQHDLGDALERLSRYEEAEKPMRRAHELNPEKSYYLSDLVDVLIKEKKLDDAGEYLEKLEDLDPEGSNTQYLKDELRDSLELEHRAIPGALEEDLANARAAQAEDPEDVAAYRLEANALDGMKQYAGAEQAYRRALELDPGDVETRRKLMENLSLQGKLVEVVEETDRILAIDPDNQDAPVYRYNTMVWSKEEYNRQLAEKNAALEQAESVAEKSQEAASADSLDQAKADAMIGFDTAEEPMVYVDVPEEAPADPQVSDGERTPAIETFENKRDELRQKRRALEEKLDNLESADVRDDVAVAELKQEISHIQNNENFLNFSITEELNRDGAERLRDAAREEPYETASGEDVVQATEMAIGDQALSEEDKRQSEEALKQIRQRAMEDLKKKIGEQYQQNIEDARLQEKVDEWIESSPYVKAAVLKDRQRRKKAAEIYEQRKNQPAGDSDQLIQAVGAPGAMPWPGEQNPEAPLENPVALEEERDQEMMGIYQQ